MMHRRTVLAALAAAPGLLAAAAGAQEARAAGIEISGGFARATAGMATAGAAFLTITSLGGADLLVGFASPACNRPELHTHIDDNGVMRMRQVEAIEVPAGGTAELKPGGLHLMLIDLNGPLVEGESVVVTLMFETAGAVEVTLPIKAAGATM